MAKKRDRDEFWSSGDRLSQLHGYKSPNSIPEFPTSNAPNPPHKKSLESPGRQSQYVPYVPSTNLLYSWSNLAYYQGSNLADEHSSALENQKAKNLANGNLSYLENDQESNLETFPSSNSDYDKEGLFFKLINAKPMAKLRENQAEAHTQAGVQNSVILPALLESLNPSTLEGGIQTSMPHFPKEQHSSLVRSHFESTDGLLNYFYKSGSSLKSRKNSKSWPTMLHHQQKVPNDEKCRLDEVPTGFQFFRFDHANSSRGQCGKSENITPEGITKEEYISSGKQSHSLSQSLSEFYRSAHSQIENKIIQNPQGQLKGFSARLLGANDELVTHSLTVKSSLQEIKFDSDAFGIKDPLPVETLKLKMIKKLIESEGKKVLLVDVSSSHKALTKLYQLHQASRKEADIKTRKNDLNNINYRNQRRRLNQISLDVLWSHKDGWVKYWEERAGQEVHLLLTDRVDPSLINVQKLFLMFLFYVETIDKIIDKDEVEILIQDYPKKFWRVFHQLHSCLPVPARDKTETPEDFLKLFQTGNINRSFTRHKIFPTLMIALGKWIKQSPQKKFRAIYFEGQGEMGNSLVKGFLADIVCFSIKNLSDRLCG